uniref:Protein PLASTID MOVEMENT IMPAIRED 2 n=1 Tax=Cajanus cajan TaxID=3821 RepID=A0A151TDA4_CAJCA|nr:Protein PLASTID MOVEMENT IMPAIRED 2 [Cajanus cajan]
MDGAELGSRRRIGSVKAAVNFYDDKVADIDGPSLKKTQMDFSLKPSSRTRELHRARRDIGRYKETRWAAESAKAQAESELSNAKKMVKNLSSMIEESSNKAKTQMRDVEGLEKWGKGQHGAMVVAKRNENYEYAQVMRELEYLKKELNWEESEDSMMLQTIIEELEAAKKELALVREEGFQFMASMDVIRNELKHVTAETDNLKKKEGKVDSTVQNLNSKILRARTKLEAVSAAEEKARSIFMKRLQGVMQELEVAKAAEAQALEKLKTLTETTMKERALTAQHSSLITISKFEYEYLTNHAASAEEIADKKVAAAEAWIEALKASEKEIMMETKIAQRELKETKLVQELEIYTKEKLHSRRDSSEELENWPRKREKSSSKNFQRAMSRKSIKLNGTITPARAAKFQKNASPAARHVSPFAIKKRKKVIPNLTKLFRGKRNSGDTQ